MRGQRCSRAGAFIAGALMTWPVPGHGQILEVMPEASMVAQPLTVRATGLRPGQPVILRALSTDSEGQVWQSFAGFYADRLGVVDVSEQAPVSGLYAGVEPMGLVTSMDLPSADRKWAQRFQLPPERPVYFTFLLEIEDAIADSVVVERWYVHPDVEVREVRDSGLVARLFLPPGGPHPGLVVWGGSGGGIQLASSTGSLFASQGFAVLALAYFGMEGLPSEPLLRSEVSLEYFGTAIRWLASRPFVAGGRVAVMGTSRGSEPALWAGTLYPEVGAVIAIHPSSVSWSSWTLNGEALDYGPWDPEPTNRPPPGFPIDYAMDFRHSLHSENNHGQIQRSRIPVEQLRAPLLLISGTEDRVWPSTEMADMIVSQLRGQSHPYEARHVTYEGLGHDLELAYVPVRGVSHPYYSGDSHGFKKAQREALPEIVAFLRRALGAQADRESE